MLRHNAAMLDYRQLIDLGLSPDIDTLTARTVAAAEAMGFGLCSGVLISGRFGSPSCAMKAFGNTPEAFVEASKSLDDGLRDPLLARLLAGPGHVAYDQAFYVAAGTADLWDCQAPFGYRAGLSCSTHHPNVAEAFLFGLDSPAALPTQASSRLALQATLQVLTLHAGSALKRLVGRPPNVELERGERVAVQTLGATIYTQRGKHFLIERLQDPALQSAAKKLRATSATDVVLRAIDGGLIQR